ncbi:unnamed protein product [Owenia fusiformis]|uniref:Pachytene checkpoint protein 2 homolog n=1 Tax=Owenia fusiformis TaxID=6347 RepID=A0A8J1UT54_OWEFU|nr:unnamed protein product [Owenia fusiformis]
MDEIGELGEMLPVPGEPRVLHVDVCQDPCSTVKAASIKEHVKRLFHKRECPLGDMKLTEFNDEFLTEHVKCIEVTDSEFEDSTQSPNLSSITVEVHVYQVHKGGPAQEDLDEEEELAAANHWLLPSSDFQGMWENLIFDSHIKRELLQYASTTLLFSDCNVDSNIITWNRVVLLHGPPGTGKTSLCKALAQKLCIRMSDRYSYGQLIEINSHSLFSKWFSESGKLVMKMFQKIQELIDDSDALVCVLIDEVESLTSARKSAMSGSEPSDAIRVVNALLTQIDQIKRYPNVLILTTSNVTGAIDLAFVDRADIKQYIGPPSPEAIFKILHSCISELMRAGIISPPQQLLDLKALKMMNFVKNELTSLSLMLRQIAIESYGLSGRTLRKLPFIAHATFLQSSKVGLEKFLSALDLAVKKQFSDRNDLEKD